MNIFQRERKMEEKLKSLKLTIQFLCNTISNAADEIDKNPALAKLMLKDALNDNRHEFK